MRSKIYFASIISLLLVFPICSYSQVNDVSFLLSKIRNTYVGYQDNLIKTQFDQHIANVLKQEQDTFLILSKIVSFFNDPHLRVFDVYGTNVVNNDSAENVMMHRYAIKYLADPALKKDTKEGFYYNERKTTVWAVIKSHANPSRYDIVLIESRSKVLPYGFVTGYLTKNSKGEFYTEYRNPVAGRLYLKSKFKNDSIFIIGELTKLKKTRNLNTIPKLDTLAPLRNFTTGSRLNETNYLLTIPDFSFENIQVVDSIINRDQHILSEVKNLIIDIRGNTGGTVKAFRALQKYVYTNPIITPSGYTYCSADLLQQNKESLVEIQTRYPSDTSLINSVKRDIEKVERNLGKLLFEYGDTLTSEQTLEYPKNVAIIANYASESAAELMILNYKQSKKVTVFGENTAGGVDFLDACSFEFPSHKYTLNLATVKRALTSEQPRIDGKGIPPDVVIPDSCEDWPGFVKKYYEKR